MQVGLRERFWALLARGEAVERDPTEPVELDVVPLFQGPLLMAALEDAGIQATMVEAFDVVTRTRTQARIIVLRADLDAARQVLEDLR